MSAKAPDNMPHGSVCSLAVRAPKKQKQHQNEGQNPLAINFFPLLGGGIHLWHTAHAETPPQASLGETTHGTS